MKSLGILSFHGAHNYGSMLQNFALQKALQGMFPDLDIETINLRNPAQDDMYNIFKPFHKYTDKKRYIFKVIMYPWKRQILLKQKLFESFLENNIRTGRRVSTHEDLVNLDKKDIYITGSDQIWNFFAGDFDWAYFLDFVARNEGVRKIAYAPSMGPNPGGLDLSPADRVKLRRLLGEYDAISVREEKTAATVKELGELPEAPEVLPDPTLLLSQEDWNRLLPVENNQKSETPYIFLYNPYYLKEVYDQAKILSKITGLPIVTSTLAPKTIMPSRGMIKKLDTGPKEFLDLIRNAEIVIGRSFHLAVFAMIFNKRFIAVEGLGDSRLSNFLRHIGMEKCATVNGSVESTLNGLSDTDWDKCNAGLNTMRKKGLEFLSKNVK